MKRICFLTGCIASLCFTAVAQDLDTPAPISVLNGELLRKGNVLFDLNRLANYTNYKIENNGVKYAEGSKFNLDLGATYMLSSRFGAGLDFSLDLQKVEVNSENTTSDVMLWAHGLYGRPLSNTVDFIVKAGVGYGMEKEKIKPLSGNTIEQDWNTLGFRASVNFPIRIQGGPVYFTPRIGYKRLCIDYEDEEESLNQFSVGFNLMAALGRSEHACDGRLGHPQGNSRYDAGNHYIGYYSKGMFGFGGVKTEYNGGEYDSDFSEGHVRLDYTYYPINNVYVGTELMWGRDVFEPGYQTGYKYTDTRFVFEPHVGFNIPVKAPWRNTFLEFSYGIGSEKSKEDDNGNVDEFKYDLSMYSGTLGYNFFFADQVAFTPMIRYSVEKREWEGGSMNFEDKQMGFQVRAGFRYFINR